jgi:hypothetical protein
MRANQMTRFLRVEMKEIEKAFGTLNEQYHDRWLFQPMTEGMTGRIQRYLVESTKQPGEYDKAYKKDHPNG